MIRNFLQTLKDFEWQIYAGCAMVAMVVMMKSIGGADAKAPETVTITLVLLSIMWIFLVIAFIDARNDSFKSAKDDSIRRDD